ncbi:hypothetical protein ALC56_15307 [Trachymyrmex septentrionalis]|uniref:DNA-directed DNA polymerase n=1 Tax=Trachymyrmex septentrionalis TaxID=34720 RepID=A0A195EQ16_9HYME|nr:hypothetical protein ALC56_15307 [Trachymyrmex septentrionalis]
MENHERVERELLEQYSQVAILVECFAWLQRCDECIERLEELCRTKRPRLTVGHRQSMVARIARLAGAKTQLERRFMHVGSGYASRDERSLVCREIDAAFENRISTSAVVNVDYIEPTEWYEQYIIEPTLTSLEEFQERDSGWALSRILNLVVNVNKLNPMRAGCYFEVPREIATKRAVINVRTMDNACFAWSVVAALYPAEKHAERESSYPYYTTVLNLAGIEFLITFKDIYKFERLNAVSINVYGIENKQVLPLRLTSDKKDKHVNLLYMQDSHNDNIKHFAWIKNLSRLVSSQLSKKKNKKYFCDRCLHYFGTNEKLQSHTMDCQKINDCAIRLPSEDEKWLEFGNNKERAPFVVYADMECVLRKTEPDREDASSYAYQRHEVFSIGYMRCSYDDALSSYQFRRDKDCIAWFTRQLNDLAHRVKNIVSANVLMERLSKEQWEAYRSATRCHICEKPFASEDTRVRDHCHLIPIVFHNLSGYDAHFIIKEIATAYEGRVDVLPITKEKYIFDTKDKTENNSQRNCVKLRFIDFFKFLSTSLDKLASYLDKDKLKIIRSKFSTLSDDEFELLTRKGVFPYEYVDCAEKLQDTRLPPRESFYSSLTGDTYPRAITLTRRTYGSDSPSERSASTVIAT